jgi:phosphatidylinositol alpha-1,6-mannosyltransferase
MRLLLFSSEFPPGPGGIGAHAHALATQFARRDWDVAVLTLQDHATKDEISAFNERQPFAILSLRRLPFFPLQAAYRFAKLAQAVRHFSPEVIVATGSRPVWLTALLRRVSAYPWAAVVHGGAEFGLAGRWDRVMSRWAYEQADAAICVSEYSRSNMLDSGIHPRQPLVITNGADEGKYYPLDDAGAVFRDQLGLGDVPLLLTVGSVSERKGQEIVIRAMPHVLKLIPDAHYLMAGLPTIRPKLEALAGELGVRDRVHFLGRVDDAALLGAYNACDVFVMTSRHSTEGDFEGYGIAVVEAALCGKPAVVSDDSGLVEAVIDGETGYHAPIDDAEATAAALIELLQDRELRQRMGQAARGRALREQTWSRQAERYAEVLQSLAGNQHP